MNTKEVSEKLRTEGFSVDIQGNQVYAHIEQEVRISQIYLILEGKVPYNNIEKIGDRTFRITAPENIS